MTILCVATPDPCPSTQQLDPANCCSEPNSKFSTLAECEERRDLILTQASVFVLEAKCYNGIKSPAVRIK